MLKENITFGAQRPSGNWSACLARWMIDRHGGVRILADLCGLDEGNDLLKVQ